MTIGRRTLLTALAGLAAAPARAADPLRAVYIVANLAQATRDPVTGRPAGVVVDLANELARQAGTTATITPIETAARVLDAVRTGAADIGFVAPNPERQGIVLYSQTYMLVQQSAVVPDGSTLTSVQDLDRAGQTIGANKDDSVSVWLKSHLHLATTRESADYTLAEAATWLKSGTIAALDELRANGFLAAAMARSGVDGISVAPPAK